MPVKILKPERKNIKEAAKILKSGGLVAFPTETVYGLGVSALNEISVAKLYEVKKRPYFDPIIVHIAEKRSLNKLVKKIPEKAEELIEKFWPGPLTLVLPKSDIIPDIVTAGQKTVAVRMPSHPVALEFIKETELPVAAPSANIFGKLSPTDAEHVLEQLGNEIDLIIDGGKCDIGVESTILDLTDSPKILRPGGLPVEEIEKVVGKLELVFFNEKPKSPGQLKSHYAPEVPLKIVQTQNFDIPENLKAGFLAFRQVTKKERFKAIEILSTSGDLKEAACNLFRCLHKLQNSGVDIIYAESVPEEGLGIAIMDRLRKAEGL